MSLKVINLKIFAIITQNSRHNFGVRNSHKGAYNEQEKRGKKGSFSLLWWA